MGLTEGHWFEDEECLTERQLEDVIGRENDVYQRGYQKGLQDGCNKVKWISVKDKLPEEFTDVLVYAEYESTVLSEISRSKGVCIGWYGDGRWHVDMRCRVVGLYWMPIIDPPKKG